MARIIIAGLLALISATAAQAGIDYPPIPIPTTFSGTTCTSCSMVGPSFTLPVSVNGNPLVTSVNTQTGDVTGLATTASLSSYATVSSLSGYATTASLSAYATAAALSTASLSLLPIFDHTGAAKTPSHAVVDTCTLALGSCTVTLTGSSAFTSSTSYSCTGADQSLAATLSTISNISGTSFYVKGSLSDVVRYMCIGW